MRGRGLRGITLKPSSLRLFLVLSEILERNMEKREKIWNRKGV
jgi:hypothetical protein